MRRATAHRAVATTTKQQRATRLSRPLFYPLCRMWTRSPPRKRSRRLTVSLRSVALAMTVTAAAIAAAIAVAIPAAVVTGSTNASAPAVRHQDRRVCGGGVAGLIGTGD